MNSSYGIIRLYGITQDPETKNYMIVLACEKCNYVCYAVHFQQNFENWTSGNDGIDKFIQDSQLSAHYNLSEALEWIPFNRFSNVSYNTKDEFGEVYNANWVDGSIWKWDKKNQNWLRRDQNMVVTLKSLDDSKNITSEFMNKV